MQKDAGAIFVAHKNTNSLPEERKAPDIMIPDIVVDDTGGKLELGGRRSSYDNVVCARARKLQVRWSRALLIGRSFRNMRAPGSSPGLYVFWVGLCLRALENKGGQGVDLRIRERLWQWPRHRAPREVEHRSRVRNVERHGAIAFAGCIDQHGVGPALTIGEEPVQAIIENRTVLSPKSPALLRDE